MPIASQVVSRGMLLFQRPQPPDRPECLRQEQKAEIVERVERKRGKDPGSTAGAGRAACSLSFVQNGTRKSALPMPEHRQPTHPHLPAIVEVQGVEQEKQCRNPPHALRG